jgi:hypothetical protein
MNEQIKHVAIAASTILAGMAGGGVMYRLFAGKWSLTFFIIGAIVSLGPAAASFRCKK